MRFHNFTYLLKEGGRNIFSNKLMSFACIGVLVACFLLIGSAVLLTLTVNNIVRYVENQNEVVAFLDDDLTEDDISVINLTLKNMENVAQITFEPKATALEKQRVSFGSKAFLLDGLERSNPLPDAYIIQVKDLSELSDTVGDIREINGVYKVNSQDEVAAVLSGVKTIVNNAGAGIVLILIAVSVVIITNTIKMTVFSRRKEINIMKYVGATDGFIRMPFLVEGMLIGLIAAVLAFLILGISYTYLLSWADTHYGQYLGVILNSAVDYHLVGPYIFTGFAAIGIFIGVIGSGFFVRRYLKV